LIAPQSNSLFATLSPDQLELLRQSGREKNLRDGEVIFKEGDPGDGLYLVEEGQVRIAAVMGDGTNRPLALVDAGDFFGEMAVLDNQPRSANAVAVGDTIVLFLPRDEVLAFLERSPRAALNLVREFSQRLRDFNRKFVEELLQADRLSMVGKFAGSIVHDFKNPLSIIGMSAELGTMEGASQEVRDSSRARIGKQVQRMSSMIGELLEFTRGSRKAETEIRNFAEFFPPLIADLRAESAASHVLIELENNPPKVNLAIDEKRLPNLFFNLVHNAVDAMKPKGGKVIFRFRTVDTMLVIEIEDTGKGIPPQIIGRMFEPFATYGKVGGTGLGLSICQRIAHDHGGTLTARNDPGHGAIFALTLPIQVTTKPPDEK
jgi:signal transduction histidine kinase